MAVERAIDKLRKAFMRRCPQQLRNKSGVSQLYILTLYWTPRTIADLLASN